MAVRDYVGCPARRGSAALSSRLGYINSFIRGIVIDPRAIVFGSGREKEERR